MKLTECYPLLVAYTEDAVLVEVLDTTRLLHFVYRTPPIEAANTALCWHEYYGRFDPLVLAEMIHIAIARPCPRCGGA